MVKILSWNILQGGGRRAENIAKAILDHKPDIVTLQEFRNGDGGKHIAAALKNAGLTYQYFGETEKSSEHTIFIASRFGFDAGEFLSEPVTPIPILEAFFSKEQLGFELILLPVHFPQKKPQVPLFVKLIEETRSLIKTNTLLIGDLNCGIPLEDSQTDSFFATQYFQTMLNDGWIDSWRSRNKEAREFTWISSVRKNGFRYDQALSSSSFDQQIKKIYYDHTVRDNKYSDHSAMLVEL